MPLFVFESSDFDVLWARFQETLNQPLASPLAVERIVVPGRGWESVFNRRLANERGCWAQFEFLPFGMWIAHVFETVLGTELAPRRELDSLTWAVAKRLPLFCHDADFREVEHYIYPTPKQLDPQRLVELARCIGRLFDRYLLERPALIDAWKYGRVWPVPDDAVPTAARWQQKLWASITEQIPYRSVQAMAGDVERLLKDPACPRDERVHVWLAGGINAAQLRFMEAVGRHVDIFVSVLVPATEYWGDLENRRSLLRKRRQAEGSLREFCRVEQIDFLHPLLASCGELSRHQQMLLADCQDEPWQFLEVGADHANGSQQNRDDADFEADHEADDDESMTLLKQLQQDIHRAGEPLPRTWSRDDSLTIHSCHTALREVEVLRDQLRAALDADATLIPEDIAVFCTDLETYAPLVQAVFGADAIHGIGRIPFHVAGRSPRRTRPIFESYFRLLAIFQGRFSISEVIDLLHVEAVSSRAGFDAEDVAETARWAMDSGVRWGLDAAQRQSEGLPETDLNTWDFGLNRLVLGYAMPPGSESLRGDVVALDRAAGLSGQRLGRLWDFVRRLRDWQTRLATARPIASWRDLFIELATEFLDPGTDEGGLQRLLLAITHLAELAEGNEFDLPLPFAVVAREVEREIEELTTGNPFRVGGVTFTDMSSLRGLPYRVVALLGMNDGDYPRRDRPMRFDLIAHRPMIGDRTARLDDRHLFLEALLSARDRVLITYQGQGIRDQKSRPPSVLVEELLALLIEPDSVATSIRETVFVEHPLQAFSPKYFDGRNPALFSYEHSALQAAERIAADKLPAPIFADQPLPEPPKKQELSTDELRLVLLAPWQLYLQRLRVSAGDAAAEIKNREPLLLDPLEEWQVGDQWLRARLQGSTVDELTHRFQRSGLIPAGPLGNASIKRLVAVTEHLMMRAEREGILEASTASPRAAQKVQYSNLKTKHMLELWFEHLMLTVAENRILDRSVLIARDQTFFMNPVDPEVAQRELDKLQRLGRIAQCWPLPFFPDCIDAKQLHQDWDFSNDEFVSKLMKNAYAAMTGTYSGFGLAFNESVRVAFRGLVPLDLQCHEIKPFAAYADRNLYRHLVEELVSGAAAQVVHKRG